MPKCNKCNKETPTEFISEGMCEYCWQLLEDQEEVEDYDDPYDRKEVTDNE